MATKFDKFKDSVQNGVEITAKKSQELIEISTLRYEILATEKKVEALFKKVGEKLYNQYKNEKINNNDYTKICKEIDELNEDIRYYKNKIDKIKNGK